jgi:lipoprotein-releasing system permease protein
MATFNVIGSLTMLIVDKKKDTQILRQLGASPPVIRRLFLFEGLLISTAGGIIGLGLGIILVWIQEVFGVIGLGDGSGAFVIDAYPVDLQLMDIFVVLFTVLVIGSLASFMTVKWLVKKLV